MNPAPLALLLLASLGAPALAQDAPGPVRLVSTEAMDPEVVALVESKAAEVQVALEALAAAEGEAQAAARGALGQAHAELGLAYEANTMWTPAQASYEHAVALLPDKPEWRYRLGVCQVALGDVQDALETFRAVAGELTNTAVVQARLGDTALMLGHLEEAEAAWQAALDSEAKLTQPLKFPESRVGMAQVRFEQDRLEDAEALLREALTLNPGYRHARYLLGLVLVEQGRDQEAELELARGVNAWPSFPPDPHQPRLSAYSAGYGRRMMIVENLLQAGQVHQAMQALTALREERPNDHFVLNLMARTLNMQGRGDEALALLRESEQKNPKVQDTKVELAIALVNRAGQTQDPVERGAVMQEALTKINQAIEIAPLRGRPWFYRGLIELQRMDPSDPQAAQQTMQTATQFLQRAHQLGCTEPQLFEQLAQIYANMGRTRDMLKFAREGAQRSPENPGSWMFLARAELTVQNFDDALLALSRAETVAAGNPQLAAQVADFAQRMRAAVAQQRAAAQTPQTEGGR